MMLAFKVQDWSHMKDSDRRKLHKQIDKLSKPVTKSNQGKRLSNEELAKVLMNR